MPGLRGVRGGVGVRYAAVMSKADLPSIVVMGPGRAGQSLAKRWVDAGVVVHGFLGRTIQGAAGAVKFVGAGRVLDISEIDAKFLETTDAVLLSVQDDRLPQAVGQLADRVASAGANRSILFFHCSGSNDLSVLEPLRSLPEFDSIYREIAADMAAQLEVVKAKETLETACVSD